MRKLLHPNNRPNNIFSHYKRIIYQVLLDRMAAVKTTGQIEYGKAISVVNLSAAICAVRINASSNPVSMSRSLSYSARLRFRCAWQLVVVEIDPHIRWVLTSVLSHK